MNEPDLAAPGSNTASESPWMRRWIAGGWMLAALPAAFTAFLLLHALHVRLSLGRWPVVYRDNPSTPLLRFHEYGLLFPSF